MTRFEHRKGRRLKFLFFTSTFNLLETRIVRSNVLASCSIPFLRLYQISNNPHSLWSFVCTRGIFLGRSAKLNSQASLLQMCFSKKRVLKKGEMQFAPLIYEEIHKELLNTINANL
jgi:hypothetical protein